MAKKYIDREAAELYICRNFCEFINSIHCHPDDCDLIKDFDNTLDAAAVVEVVRCGECKHCVEHYDTDGNAPYWVCKEWDSGTDYDGYCHYGEKKGR